MGSGLIRSRLARLEQATAPDAPFRHLLARLQDAERRGDLGTIERLIARASDADLDRLVGSWDASGFTDAELRMIADGRLCPK